MKYETDVLIIGGGATGIGLARDLALRGVPCLLVEQADLDAGASGANHGLLHSGGRYVSNDSKSAAHCLKEGRLLKKLARHCIEDTRGLFVAIEGDNESFIADFPGFCERSGLPVRTLSPAEARELEPTLSEKVIAAYEVEDATVDPFKLALDNMAHARQLGSTLLANTRVVGLELDNRRIRSGQLLNTRTGESSVVEAKEVVNAAGAWSGEVAAMAGISFNILFSKGTLLITQNRVTKRVVNRLRKPSDADIIVPGGTVSVLGTTSIRIDSLDYIGPTVQEVDKILDETAAMVPVLEDTRIIRAYAGVRPLVSLGSAGDDRSVTRDLALFDHGKQGVENFVTITGGKLTTYRHMAEKAADVVCSHLGVTAPCLTREQPLPPACRWSFPGISPLTWLERGDPKDVLLCECEMVPRSAIDDIVNEILEKDHRPGLKDIGLRSRIGKGSCQGAFCGPRVLAHLYEQGRFEGEEGLASLREFLNERWKGTHTVYWGTQLGQAELTEALHCGFFGLEAK